MIYESADAFLGAALARAWNHPDLRVTRLVGWLSDMGEPLWDDEVPTIAIRRTGRRYRLLIGRSFVNEWARSGADALFLLLHELSHRVRGDLLSITGAFDSPASAHLHNLAADLVLNADLSRRFFPLGVDLLGRFYDPTRFPSNLLVPPAALVAAHGPVEGFGEVEYVADTTSFFARGPDAPPGRPSPKGPTWCHGPRETRALLRALFQRSAGEFADEAAQLYMKVWFGTSTRTDEVVAALERIASRCDDLAVLAVLGDHRNDEDAIALPLTDEERAMLAREYRGGGAGTGGAEVEEHIEPLVDARSQALYEALRRALEFDASRSRLVQGPTCATTPVPSPSRRAIALAASGCWPGLFRAEVPGLRTEESAAHVYIDLSGSMQHRWPLLYGLVLHLRDQIGLPAHGFSTTVVDLGDDALQAGRVPTTGGTSIDCVVEHARAAGYRRIVVLTDGEVLMNPSTERALSSAEPELYLVLDQPHQRRCRLADLARETWTLDDGDGSDGPASTGYEADDVPF